MNYNPKYPTDKERIQALTNLEALRKWSKTPDNEIPTYKPTKVKKGLKIWQVFALLKSLKP